ncbi:potassium voltage-gated channel subfamily H member 2 [Clonorchis sinensis]|uniref:Potassium voltage-gated channel subfamily H member 2 n=1 Tax=Clonorchis sinensis TaxID=79923 RepID=H2KS78_CLOSI|nr:potassium voltage-gated channel subfamily H member 2 [Clonorchis sinensis]
MPIKRGHVAPQNTFIDTLIQKFDSQRRKFLIANAVLPQTPIIFCNDDLCTMCGYSRAEILQRSAALEFLYGPLTSSKAVGELKQALTDTEERVILAILYNKAGFHFVCQIAVAPVRNAECQVRLYILTFRGMSDFEDADVVKSKSDRGKLSVLASQFHRIVGLTRILTSIGHRATHSPAHHTTVIPEEINQEQFVHSSMELASTVSLARRHSSADHHFGQSSDSAHLGAPEAASSHLNLSTVSQTSSMLLDGGETTKKSHRCFPTRTNSGSSQGLRVGSAVAHGTGGIVITTDSGLMSHRNVSDKVAEMLSLGPDVHPEHKLHSPRIHPFTLKHYGPVKAVWDWLILGLVIYTAIFTPYAAAFHLLEENKTTRKSGEWSTLRAIDFFVDIMFIIDIFINFRTTYVNKNDELISDPGRIAVHYFKGWLLIDVVAAIPFDLIQIGAQTDDMVKLIGLLKTARLLRLVRVVRKLDRYSEYGAAVLLLLMATFVLIAHWLACIWYFVGHIQRQKHYIWTGWLDTLAAQIQQPYTNRSTMGPTIQAKYITALYFTFSSLTSVGFGNVSPNTNPEKIFSICVMLVGSLMYAGIFGHVSAIIQRLYSGTARYHIQMLRVKEFIRFHQIPNPLKRRLEEFFQHAWSYTNGIDMNFVLRSFPECLQADICLHLNRHLFETSLPFKGASQGCLRSLALKMKTTHVQPGDTLVHKGDVLCFICFIARGSIEVVMGSDIVAVLCQGDVFGENPFGQDLMGQSKFCVRALTYCDLHKIQHDDLFEILEMYPEFAKRFRQKLEITLDLQNAPVPGDVCPMHWDGALKKLSICHHMDTGKGDQPYETDFPAPLTIKGPLSSSAPYLSMLEQEAIDLDRPLLRENDRLLSAARITNNTQNKEHPLSPVPFSTSTELRKLGSPPPSRHDGVASASPVHETRPPRYPPSTVLPRTELDLLPDSNDYDTVVPLGVGSIDLGSLMVGLTTRLLSIEQQLVDLEQKFDANLSEVLQLVQTIPTSNLPSTMAA